METPYFLGQVYFGNTVRDYFIALAIFAGGLAALRLLKMIAFNRLEQWARMTVSGLDELLVTLLNKTIIPLLYLAAFYFAMTHLVMAPALAKAVKGFCVIILTFQIVRLITGSVFMVVKQKWLDSHSAGPNLIASKGLLLVLRIVVWSIGIVFVMDNLGFNISAVVAGLGIGGIAIAFAVQAILGDLFNYFVILFDEPFHEGDSIVLDNYSGEIENIGIKSTRIRSVDGEQIVISNTDLTSSRIRNFKRMDKRRILFRLGVVYQTPDAKMQRIPEMLRDIIRQTEKTVFDRAHFQGFGASSLDIEVVYYVLGRDYNEYMDIQQTINLKIMRVFEQEQIEFAFPTQTVIMQRSHEHSGKLGKSAATN